MIEAHSGGAIWYGVNLLDYDINSLMPLDIQDDKPVLRILLMSGLHVRRSF